MERVRKLLWLVLILFFTVIPLTSPQGHARSEDRGGGEPILVGRISYVEGKVLRYVTEEEDWVATVSDTPFGVDDSLYSDKGGRAEIIMPNNTWARIDGDTQIQLITLRYDVTEIDVASGAARFYNKGSDPVIKARTPFGYVMGPGDTSFDLYVGDYSAEVVAVEGTVYFVHRTSETKFEVIAGSSSILADSREVTAGEAETDPYWHAWNRKRDGLWAKRMRVKGKSATYLPSRLHYDAYVLEEHGRWERVYYNGGYYYFWRPVYVSAGWAPFTAGRWIVWYGDHTWIPDEPFGYITHHYGSWIFTGGSWYWAPPVPHVVVYGGPPLLHVGFAWYPGRVAWIHFGFHVGWVPLAPGEPYYCYRRWGPGAIIVNNVHITKVHFNPHRYRHFKHAVIIEKKNLYKVDDYRRIRITGVNRTATLEKYRAVPVVDHRVIKNYKNIRQRYNVTNLREVRKPPRMVTRGIQEDHRGANARGKGIPDRVRNRKEDRLAEEARIKPPKVRNEAISVNQVRRGSASRKKSGERELKRKEKPRLENQGQAGREFRKRWSRMPPKPASGHTARQRIARREVQNQRKKMPPKPATGHRMPRKEGKLGRSHVREERGRMPPRPEPKLQKGSQPRVKSQGNRRGRWNRGDYKQHMQRRGGEKQRRRDFPRQAPSHPGNPSARSWPSSA
jgi:hypothetical protein